MADDPIYRPSRDGLTITACAVAFNAAIQTIVALLENAGVLEAGQFAEGLRGYIDSAGEAINPLSVALLEEMANLPRTDRRPKQNS